MRRISALLLPCLLLLASPATLRADRSQGLFDPARHMRVAEVRPGMKGYGLSVFHGTAIERFDVEVVSILRNYNPRRHVVLIRCNGQNLEHTGAIQGMSGSPVFLRDDAGNERMIGAFAYGWSLAKDPIAGVQPIEYMLDLPTEPTTQPSDAASAGRGVGNGAAAGPRQSWNVWEAYGRRMAGGGSLATPLFEGVESPRPASSIRPLGAPVTAAGFSASLLGAYEQTFTRSGLTLLQGGGGRMSGVAGVAAEADGAPIAPGSVLIAPLLVGDAEIHANGTCTEVLGDRVYAFGHPFNNEGRIAIPFAGGAVSAVVASLDSSFKIAAMGAMRGELRSDESVGVAGRLGDSPEMVPIRIAVTRAGAAPGDAPDVYQFRGIRHPRFLPIVTAMAMEAALVGDAQLPQYSTVAYDVTLTFDNGRTVRFDNVDAHARPPEMLFSIVMPIMAAAENPFQRVLPTRVEGTMRVTAESRQAQILSAQLPKTRFHPGDGVEAFLAYRPFRGDEATLPVQIDLPRDLPEGTYQLVIGDYERFLADESAAKPFKFIAEDADDVFEILQDLASVRHDMLYLRLVRQPDGVAVGRVAMDALPSSRRQVLLNAGRSNVTPYVSSLVKKVPTTLHLRGAAEFTIQVERKTRVETAPAAVPSAMPTTRPGA